jgi:hypothetical protein
MARKRVRAAARKAGARATADEALVIADGVYHVARDVLEGPLPRVELPLPVYAFAPLAYVCEVTAAVLCERHELGAERQHEVALYLLAGMQEVLVAAVAGFDREHLEAWVAAASLGGEKGVG